MQQTKTPDKRPRADETRFVMAVFDDWDALHDVLAGMEANGSVRSGALLHARRDAPSAAPDQGLLRDLLEEMTELHFAPSHQRVVCTMGRLAQELSARLGAGARNMVEAMHGWLSPDQAWQLESHIEKGRLVLCVELHSSEDYAVVCGRLVQASPHLVGLCNIKIEA